MHDGARTVAPAISAAGLWVAGSIVDEKEVSPDSIGSNKRAEDASAAICDRYLAKRTAPRARVADMDRFSGRAKGGEIAAGIDQAMGLIALGKAIDRAINGKPLGYPAKIDFHSRMMEANMILREQLDGIARCRFGTIAFDIRAVAGQQPQSLQRRRYRDIEYAV